MEKIWYYTIDGERRGPVTAAELKELASQGTLKPDDLLWKEGLTEWTPAKKLKGLFPEGQASSEPEEKPTPEEKPKLKNDSPKNDRDNLKLSGRSKREDDSPSKSRSRDDDRRERDDRDEDRRPSRKFRRDDYEDDDADWNRRSSRRDRYDDDYRRDEYHSQKDDYDDARPRRNVKSPTLGIFSMICGILSILLVPIGFFGVCCVVFFFVNALPMIPALVAIVLGLIGMNKSHRGMSIAGVITGAIGLILSALMLVLSFVYPAMMMAVPPPAPPAGGGGWNPPPQNPPIIRPAPRK